MKGRIDYCITSITLQEQKTNCKGTTLATVKLYKRGQVLFTFSRRVRQSKHSTKERAPLSLQCHQSSVIMAEGQTWTTFKSISLIVKSFQEEYWETLSFDNPVLKWYSYMSIYERHVNYIIYPHIVNLEYYLHVFN